MQGMSLFVEFVGVGKGFKGFWVIRVTSLVWSCDFGPLLEKYL